MAEGSGHGITVLVIDDDRGARAELASVLQRAGYAVTIRDPRQSGESGAHDFTVVSLDAMYGDEPQHASLVRRLVEESPRSVIVTALTEEAARTYPTAISIWTLASENFYEQILKALPSPEEQQRDLRPRRRCFVIMPFSEWDDVSKDEWDTFYFDTIKPTVISTHRFECSRCETLAGPPWRELIPGLLDADVVIADLTGGNPNVFYELGLRHAEPATAILISRGSLPFAANTEVYLDYATDPAKLTTFTARLKRALLHIDEQITRRCERQSFSLVSTMIEERRAVKTTAMTSDSYRELKKQKLLELEALRKLGKWDDIRDATNALPSGLAAEPEVRRLLAFAHNQARRWRDAEEVLTPLAVEHAETLCMLGRAHKDRWYELRGQAEARKELECAIDCYRRALRENPKSLIAGINVATLMTIHDRTAPELSGVLASVDELVAERVHSAAPGYFDYATQLELALLTRSKGHAMLALAEALRVASEAWQLQRTQSNLRMLREERGPKDDAAEWALVVEKQLDARAKELLTSAS